VCAQFTIEIFFCTSSRGGPRPPRPPPLATLMYTKTVCCSEHYHSVKPLIDTCVTIKHFPIECINFAAIHSRYFSAPSMKDVFENVNAQSIIDFISPGFVLHFIWLSRCWQNTAQHRAYKSTDRNVEACRGQCRNKQSLLIYQVAFYKTLSGSMNAHVS